jgi:hypothetical protein
MPTKEEDFKQRFAGILLDMRSSGSSDPEGMWLVGSLAARVVDEEQRPNWTAFKAHLSLETYRGLLSSFQQQGNALAKQGAQRQMFAIEVLAASLVAKTQSSDPEIASGDKILNKIIDNAISVYRSSQTADPLIS